MSFDIQHNNTNNESDSSVSVFPRLTSGGGVSGWPCHNSNSKSNFNSSFDALIERLEQNDPRLVDVIILPGRSSAYFGAVELDRLSRVLLLDQYGHSHCQSHDHDDDYHWTSLSASSYAIPPDAWRRFGAAIGESSRLQYVSNDYAHHNYYYNNNNSNSNSNDQERGRGRRRRRLLTGLALGDASTGDDGIIAFCQGLIQGGIRAEEEVEFIASFLQHQIQQQIQPIQCQPHHHHHHHPEVHESLSGGLSFLSLVQLDLSYKNMTCTGFHALMVALGHSQHLQVLNVSRNDFSNHTDPLSLLSSSHYDTHSHLYCDSNENDDDDESRTTTTTTTTQPHVFLFPVLIDLDMSQCQLQSRMIESLFPRLAQPQHDHHRSRILRLSHNEALAMKDTHGDQTMNHHYHNNKKKKKNRNHTNHDNLTRLLDCEYHGHWPMVQELDVSACGIGDETMRAIFSVNSITAAANTSFPVSIDCEAAAWPLQRLNLSGNGITREGVTYLADCLGSCHRHLLRSRLQR